MKSKVNKIKYCDYCHKEIAKPNTIHIAGTICEGHRLGLIEYAVYRIRKYFNEIKSK